jgi:quercetin dioxygenase-like cupin family protein
MPWISNSAGVKMLRISKETGWIAALVRGRAGQVNPPHTHLGPACFYVLEGGFEFHGGSAKSGDLGVGTGGRDRSRDFASGRYGLSL